MRCQTWTGRVQCANEATFLMFAPDGKMVPGGYGCREHTQVPIDEYAAKLQERWTAREVDEFGDLKTGGAFIEPAVAVKKVTLTKEAV